MKFVNFFATTSNLIWIDLGVLFILLFLIFIVFVTRSYYFHYLFSISFFFIGLALFFWPLLNNQITKGYDLILNNNKSENFRTFILFLKINPLINEILIFSIWFLFIVLFSSLPYFLIIKKRFNTHNGSSRIFTFFIKFLFTSIVLFGSLYVFTPFYVVLHKQHGTVAPQKTYLSDIFEKTKIYKLTTKDINPFKPIWGNLRQLENKEIDSDKFYRNLKVVDEFLQEKFPYLHRNWWKVKLITSEWNVGDLIAQTKITDASKIIEFTTEFKEWFSNESKNGKFLFFKDSL